jgi:hypothetical protein
MLASAASNRAYRNSLFFAITLLVVFYACALQLVWFAYVPGNNPVFGEVGVKGGHAEIDMLFRCPAWFLLTVSSLALLTLVFNVAGLTRIPRMAPIAALVVCGGFYLWGILEPFPPAKPQIGIWVAFLNTIAAIGLAFISPDGRVSAPRAS